MKNRRILNIIGLTIMLVFISGIALSQFSTAKTYEGISVQTNQNLTYVAETVDYDKYYEAYDTAPQNPIGGGKLFEDMRTQITIESVNEYDDYWYIDIELKVYFEDMNVKPYDMDMDVPMNPENYSVGLLVIPTDAEDFLKDWEDEIEDSPVYEDYSVKGTTVTQETNITVDGEDKDVVKEYTYTEDGILKDYILEYDGDLIIQLSSITGGISFGFTFLAVTVLAVLAIVLLYKRKIRGGMDK
ncbi:MAG: hypothetical protein EU544_02200 [Promethearchaeota archaeon]|nr:MAG: hypothetical protein EU544_02200 [Candidatus Lokiarchaeota archaeon]